MEKGLRSKDDNTFKIRVQRSNEDQIRNATGFEHSGQRLAEIKCEMPSTQEVKEIIEKNFILVLFPREAGGHFLMRLVELAYKDNAQALKNSLTQKNGLAVNEETGHWGLTMGRDVFKKIIIEKINHNSNAFVFCGHYYNFSHVEKFLKSFNVNKIILITCKAEGDRDLLNIRRKKHNTPLICDEEEQLNHIFPTFIRNEFKDSQIIEIEYKSLRNYDSYIKQLEKINEAFGINVPIEDCKPIVKIYLERII